MQVDDVNGLRRRLADNGYFCVSVRTGTKKPAEPGWQRSNDPFRPARVGALSTGIRTGSEVICIDIDCDDAAEARDVFRRVVGVLGVTPLIRSRSNSCRVALVYRAKEQGIAKTTIALGPDLDGKRQQIEVLGVGQQFVAYGQHESGVGYEWNGGSPEDVGVADLPGIDLNDLIALREEFGIIDVSGDDNVSPVVEQDERRGRARHGEAWLSEAAHGKAGRGKAERGEAGQGGADGPSFFRNVNDLALANLRAWVPELLPAAREKPAGVWRVTSRKLGRNLQEDLSITTKGIQDFGLEEPRTAIDLVMEHGGAPDAEAAALWLCGRLAVDPASIGHRSGSQTGASAHGTKVQEAKGRVLASNLLNASTLQRVKAEIGDDDEEAGDVDPCGDRYDYPMPMWLQAPGLIGEMTDWILAGSQQPNAPLAVGAAIAVMCGLAGRTLTGPTDSSPHLYIAGLGESGVGKDWPLTAVYHLMHAARLDTAYNQLKITSGTSIETILERCPVRVCPADELGDSLFARMSHKHASTHEKDISGVLRRLWSMPHYGVYQTTSRAGQVGRVIRRPSLTIYGMSTIDQFYDNLAPADVDNGFLNRWLIIRADPRAYEFRQIPDGASVVPEALAAKLAMCLATRGINGDMTGGTVDAFNVDQLPEIVKITYDAAAKALYEALTTDLKSWIDAGETMKLRAACYRRTPEIAIRLATLATLARIGRGGIMSEQDFRWGASVALASARYQFKEMALRYAETPFQAMVNKVKDYFLAAPDCVLSRTQLSRRINAKWSKQDTSKIIETLEDAGRLRAWSVPGKRKDITYYKYLSKAK